MTYIDITQSFSSTANRRIGNGLIILGMLLWIWLPYSYWQKKQFVDGAAIAVGKIVQLDGAPIITFPDKSGDIITATLSGWRPGDLKKGEEVEIAYLLDDPKWVELKSDLWFGQLATAIFALILSAIGWLLRKGLIVSGPLKQARVRIGL